MSLNFIPRNYINGSGVALGNILLPDGTAAAPALAFASDTNSGFYLVADNQIGVSLSGGLRAYFTTATFIQQPTNVVGSATSSAYLLNQILNTTGVVDGVFRMAVTNTASGVGSYIMALYGGAAGATPMFTVGMTGNAVFGGGLTIAASGGVYATGRAGIRFTGSGEATIDNSAQTGLTTLNLGPTTGNSASGSTSITHINATIDMATASGTGTGTITVPGFFTAGAKLIGFSAHVTTILAGAGLTTWSAGTGGATTLLGTSLAIAAGTKATAASYTGDIGATFYGGAAKDLVITAAAGVFSTGVLKVTATVVTTTAISA